MLYDMPRNLCLLAEEFFQKFVTVVFLDFCAKHTEKFVQFGSSISVPSNSRTICSESVQYDLHSLVYLLLDLCAKILPWNVFPWLQMHLSFFARLLSLLHSQMLMKNAQ
jgi:hypothetical protein